MDAYTTTPWAPAFTAIAGSSAALTGLLFVALSINLAQVLKGEGLVSRSVEVLVLLTAVLVASTLLLMPDQAAGTAAVEVLFVALVTEGFLGYIHVRAPKSRRMFASRVFGSHLGPVFLLVGGVSLLFQNGGGLYWVVPGMLAAMVAAIIGAWVLLVEILR